MYNTEVLIEMKRSKQLERFLANECSFDTLTNPKQMDEVDMSRTPVPIVELFYRAGEGDYPEDQDAYFEPPRQDPYALAVYKFCRKKSDNSHSFRPETREAWMQRCKKAWASMVRDVHFAFMVFEAQERTEPFDKVWFSVEKDIEDGAGLIIEHNGETYHVNLFVDSAKSRRFLNKKKNHRQPVKQAIDLEVPMTFNGPKKSIRNDGDDIWLYSEKHVHAVERVVNGSSTTVEEYGEILCKARGGSKGSSARSPADD